MGTGRSSITFNPAWISKVSMAKLKSMNIKYSSAFRPSVLQNNYIHQSDPLNKIQQLQRLGPNLLEMVGQNHFVNGGFFSNMITGHLINTMVGRLRANRDSYTHIVSPRTFE